MESVPTRDTEIRKDIYEQTKHRQKRKLNNNDKMYIAFLKYNTALNESIEYNISQKQNQYWLCKVSEINNKLVGPDDGLENRLKHVVQIKM